MHSSFLHTVLFVYFVSCLSESIPLSLYAIRKSVDLFQILFMYVPLFFLPNDGFSCMYEVGTFYANILLHTTLSIVSPSLILSLGGVRFVLSILNVSLSSHVTVILMTGFWPGQTF